VLLLFDIERSVDFNVFHNERSADRAKCGVIVCSKHTGVGQHQKSASEFRRPCAPELHPTPPSNSFESGRVSSADVGVEHAVDESQLLGVNGDIDCREFSVACKHGLRRHPDKRECDTIFRSSAVASTQRDWHNAVENSACRQAFATIAPVPAPKLHGGDSCFAAATLRHSMISVNPRNWCHTQIRWTPPDGLRSDNVDGWDAQTESVDVCDDFPTTVVDEVSMWRTRGAGSWSRGAHFTLTLPQTHEAKVKRFPH
jgi:hypothetical protein